MLPLIVCLLSLAFGAQTTSAQSVGSQECHSSDAFPGHGDVRTDDMTSGSQYCLEYSGFMFNGVIPITWNDVMDGTSYKYMVTWIDGCDGDPQDFVMPAAGVYCADLLFENWRNCEYNVLMSLAWHISNSL